MKQTTYENATIPTAGDLNFTEDSKCKAIGQTRYDILSSKGIIENSGTSAGNEDNPLKVYLTGSPATSVNVWGGVAYDSYRDTSRRLWVPDDPSDVPVNAAAAGSNFDNIDMPEENIAEDFAIANRPSRTNIKVFDGTDASGTWYVSINYVEGQYSPIVSPSNGQIIQSKTYESYQFDVSQTPASQLGEGWIQLATLSWSGTSLLIVSDDRPLASATVTGTNSLVVSHQNRYHDNGIVRASTSSDYLRPVVDNTNKLVSLEETVFSAGDGLAVGGEFLTEIGNVSVSFTDLPAAGIYYLYISSDGDFVRTDSFTVANQSFIVCSVYWDATTQTLTQDDPSLFPSTLTSTSKEVAKDRRYFGTGRVREFALFGDGNFTVESDKFYSEMDDALEFHMWQAHANFIYTPAGGLSTTFQPSASGATAVNIAGFAAGDYAFIGGWVIRSILGGSVDVDFSGEADGTYYIYAQRWWSGGTNVTTRSQCVINFSSSFPSQYYRLALAKITVSGGSVSTIVDLRNWGPLAMAHWARVYNTHGNNYFPAPLAYMTGDVTVAAGDTSDIIYLTDDFDTGNYGEGGTSDGLNMFAETPLLQVYIHGVGVMLLTYENDTVDSTPTGLGTVLAPGGTGAGVDVSGVSVSVNNSAIWIAELNNNYQNFTITNQGSVDLTFKWVAVGKTRVDISNRFNPRLLGI